MQTLNSGSSPYDSTFSIASSLIEQKVKAFRISIVIKSKVHGLLISATVEIQCRLQLKSRRQEQEKLRELETQAIESFGSKRWFVGND